MSALKPDLITVAGLASPGVYSSCVHGAADSGERTGGTLVGTVHGARERGRANIYQVPQCARSPAYCWKRCQDSAEGCDNSRVAARQERDMHRALGEHSSLRAVLRPACSNKLSTATAAGREERAFHQS